jgi:hypothetical protein
MASYSRKVDLPGKTAQEIYDKVAAEIERFLSKTPVGKSEVDRDPVSKTIKAKSSMFQATLSCKEGEIALDVSLSFLATPFRGKLDEGIDKWLAKHFPKT